MTPSSRTLSRIGAALALAISACGGDGVVAFVSPTVARPPVTALIVVDSFVMIEFKYPGSDAWFYAPQVRVHESVRGTGATITGVDFVIPGIGAAPPCATSIALAGGTAMDLFQEIYGDFQYAIFQPYARATGADAMLILTVTDRRGADTKLTLAGPVVPGELPSTFSGGNPAWGCR